MAKAKNTFTDKDTGFKKLYTKFETPKGEGAVFVGFLRSSGEYKPQAGAKNQKPITMAQLGAIHEYGSKDGKIPERSFMRTTIDANKKQIETLIKKLLNAVIDGKMTQEIALNVLGQFLADKMKNTITTQAFPNVKRSDAYAKRQAAKGKTKTLIDTGQLVNAIDKEVKMGRGTTKKGHR